ncbi:hypothetical protein ISF_01271 [Cordyceps fumosorosea ARSEF 2679]|uniref:Uncharacterized protein n=1 Tax=Cordyceps fumosorosea (strain ARSEF 2679) TaxID=1081104 RepID=A0A168D5L9_CORFA|nr:hypothetical protein ISF_01271 [Cordyceps fumosorosea ARSEF 2679]OAA72198.1 hypothetical protein ISF_01271 [Cordyceps fumosorosea ARSEF 2679]
MSSNSSSNNNNGGAGAGASGSGNGSGSGSGNGSNGSNKSSSRRGKLRAHWRQETARADVTTAEARGPRGPLAAASVPLRRPATFPQAHDKGRINMPAQDNANVATAVALDTPSSICVHPWADGFVHGCPVCNSPDHWNAVDCSLIWSSKLGKNFSMAITKRANRPPPLAFKELGHHPAFEQGIQPAVSLPWTPYMAQRLAAEGRNMPWIDFNYQMNNYRVLSTDPISTAHGGTADGRATLGRVLEDAQVMTTGGPWDGTTALPPVPPLPIKQE